jgi:hypothetical protein
MEGSSVEMKAARILVEADCEQLKKKWKKSSFAAPQRGQLSWNTGHLAWR